MESGNQAVLSVCDKIEWMLLKNGEKIPSSSFKGECLSIYGQRFQSISGFRGNVIDILKQHFNHIVDLPSDGDSCVRLKKGWKLSPLVLHLQDSLQSMQKQLHDLLNSCNGKIELSDMAKKYRARYKRNFDFSSFERIRVKPFLSLKEFLSIYLDKRFLVDKDEEVTYLSLLPGSKAVNLSKEPKCNHKKEQATAPQWNKLDTATTSQTAGKEKPISLKDIMKEEEEASIQKPQEKPNDVILGGKRDTMGLRVMHHKKSRVTDTEKEKPDVTLLWNETLNQNPTFHFNHLLDNGSRTQIYSEKEINERFTIIRRELSQMNIYFNMLDILSGLCAHFKVQSIRQLRTQKFYQGLRQENDITAAVDFLKLQDEVNTFIQAYCMASGLAVLHELEQQICKLTGKQNFKDLRLGPLHKFPLIFKHFKYPNDAKKITEITSEDVMKGLWMYMGQNKREKKDGKVDPGMFLKELSEKRGLESPYELGVKIRSVGLLIKLVKKGMFGNMDKHKELEHRIQLDMEKDLENYLWKLKSGLTGKKIVSRAGMPENLVQEVAGLNIETAIMKIFQFACRVRDEASHKMQGSGLFTFGNKLVETMIIIRNSPLLVKIFHVILATGLFQVLGKDDYELLDFLGFGSIIDKMLKERTDEAAPSISKIEPISSGTCLNVPEGLVLKKCKSYFEQCGKAMDLATLSRLEGNIAMSCDPRATVFSVLGHGSFLQFLSSHLDMVRAFGFHVVLSHQDPHRASGGPVSKEEMKEFILQCQGFDDAKSLFLVYCDQFNLDRNMATLPDDFDVAMKSKKELHEQRPTPVILYQNTLLLEDIGRISNGCSNTRTGNTTVAEAETISWGSEEDAIKCLRSAPLLEDLGKWTDWNTIFKPVCGDLKSFLRQLPNRHGGIVADIHALEVSPGVLLRIQSGATSDDFRGCLKASDVNMAAGILVSIICNCGGVRNAPLALLANCIQSALLARIGNNSSESDSVAQDMEPVRWIMKCLVRVPVKLASKLLHKVFLSPLEAVYGTNEVAQLLLDSCETMEERASLHSLGILNAIEEWIQDFRKQKIDSDGLIKKEEEMPLEHQDDDKKEQTQENVNKLLQSGDAGVVDGKGDTKDNVNQHRNREEDDDATSSTPQSDELLDESAVSEEASRCRDMIEEIRRREFGIGEVFGQRETELINAHHERLGRSLERLSKELYTKDTHFVLELVQNADDNKYPDEILSSSDGEKPAISFVINKDCVTMRNNEIGFLEENIKAICDVGKTTKGAHRKGYIGQKGIGFKSIFRVTDCPEVHSNGYHIRFDARSGSIGYIMPDWIEDTTDELPYSPAELDSAIGWTTQIKLPLKAEIMETRTSLSARFHDIHPSLLLFLNRLQVIIIDDQVNSKYSLMQKRVLENDLVELTSNRNPSLWMVLSEEVPIQVRPDIKSTDISLAFPIDDASQISLKPKPLPVQPVFAYLPLRSYGFKFVIQADFEVPSSREDIDRDSPWNQWILDKLPSLIVKAFHKFQTHPSFTPLSGAAKFFRFMSLEEEIHGSFRPMAGRILQLLQSERCIPVEVIPEQDGHQTEPVYEWSMPSSVLMQDPAVRSVIPATELKKYLDLHYMVDSVQKTLSPAFLTALGVQQITLTHLMEIVKARLHLGVSNQAKEVGKETVPWIGKWFYCVAQYLERQHDCSTETLERIKSLTIFPLANKMCKSLHDAAVFFPTEKTSSSSKKKNSKECHWNDVLDKDLQTLDRALFSDLDDIGKLRVTRFFENLGVRKRTSKEIIQNHILPALESGKWKEKDPGLLVSYMAFLKAERQRDAALIDLDVLKKHAVVLTSDGPLRPAEHPVYFGKDYGNQIDFPALFPDIKWIILSKVYLQWGDLKSWQEFFAALGINYCFSITRSTKTIYQAELTQTAWALSSSKWPVVDDGIYIIDDVSCPQLEQVLQQQDPLTCTRLAELLDKTWASHFAILNLEQKTAALRNGKNEYLCQTFTSLSLLLRHEKWLPSDLNGMTSLFAPSQLFLRTKEVEDLLDKFCQYLSANLRDSNFIDFLGITQHVNAEKLSDFLVSWSNFSSFDTTASHMQNVYLKLQAAEPSVIDAIADEKIIYVPTQERSTDSFEGGSFHNKDDVCWHDPSGVLRNRLHLFSDKMKVLDHFYDKSVKKFFCQSLRVSDSPTVRNYLEMIECLSAEVNLPDAKALSDLYSLYATIGWKCVKMSEKENVMILFDEKLSFDYQYGQIGHYLDEGLCKFVYSNLKKLEVFPTMRDTFVSLDRYPLIADKQEYYDIFKEEKDVHFLDTRKFEHWILNLHPARSAYRKVHKPSSKETSLELFQGILLFFRACDIRLLTSLLLPPEPKAEGSSKGCQMWEENFSDVLNLIQRFLYHKYEEWYGDVVASKLPSSLKNAQFYTTHRLDVIYSLELFPDVRVPRSKIFAWEFSDFAEDKIHIYIVKDQMEEREEMISEFISLFSPKDETDHDNLTTNIMAVLSLQGSARDKMLKKKGVSDIPKDELLWTLPKPKKANPPSLPIVDTEKKNVKKDEEEGLRSWPPQAPAEFTREKSQTSERSTVDRKSEFEMPSPPPGMLAFTSNHDGFKEQRRGIAGACNNSQQITNVSSSAQGYPSLRQAERKPLTVQAEAGNFVTSVYEKSYNDVKSNQDLVPKRNHCAASQMVNSEEFPSKHASLNPDNMGQAIAQNNSVDPQVVESQLGEKPVENLDSSPLKTTKELVSLSLSPTQTQVSFKEPTTLLLAYEDVPISSICADEHVKFLVDKKDSANDSEVGRIGEHLVYRHLEQLYMKEVLRGDVEIVWRNEVQESGAPYDIKLSWMADDPTQQTVSYIEVKSTSLDEVKGFEMSGQELELAFTAGDNYHLYRVSGLGTVASLKLKKLKGLSKYLHNRSVKVYLIL